MPIPWTWAMTSSSLYPSNSFTHGSCNFTLGLSPVQQKCACYQWAITYRRKRRICFYLKDRKKDDNKTYLLVFWASGNLSDIHWRVHVFDMAHLQPRGGRSVRDLVEEASETDRWMDWWVLEDDGGVDYKGLLDKYGNLVRLCLPTTIGVGTPSHWPDEP